MKRGLPLALALVCLLLLPAGAAAGGGPEGPAAAGGVAKGRVPGSLVLGNLSERFAPVRFDHAGHVEMAGGCGECHHQHGRERGTSCRECHALDASAFRGSFDAGKFRPCGECHAAAPRAAADDRPGLTAAYHRACFGCHRELGSVGEDPKGCAETCHASKE